MIGLVIVAHMRSIAEETALFVSNATGGDIPVSFAGGKNGGYKEAGSDIDDIEGAIRRVYSDDGAIVLADIGGSVHTCLAAISKLQAELPNICISSAPLVEGAMLAAAQIAAGSTLDVVLKEAKNSTTLKERLIGEHDLFSDSENALSYRFKIYNPHGLHARPAATIVKSISSMNADVKLRNVTGGTPFINGKSLNKLALSNISYGDTVEVVCTGPDRKAVMNILKDFVQESHNKHAPSVNPDKDLSKKYIKLSSGVGLGFLHITNGENHLLTPHATTDAKSEILQLENAVKKVADSLMTNKKKFLEKGLEDEAVIFEAQYLILTDSEVLRDIRNEIAASREDAASVYQRKMLDVASQFKNLTNEYMRERATDVEDITNQVINTMLGVESNQNEEFADNIILYAENLTPSFINRLSGKLKGILTNTCGATSHASILARALNIPVISGYSLPEGVASGAFVVMDADRCEVFINPDNNINDEFKLRHERWKISHSHNLKESSKPAISADGVRINVYANIGDEVTAELAKISGAEGIGLLRSEFLYLNRHTSPSEEEQVHEYKKIFEYFPDQEITVRTIDVGGDKIIPWLGMGEAETKQLGIRGIRLCKKEKELFSAQLRAILRAAYGYNVRVMLPMICTAEEVDFAREMLNEAHTELTAKGVSHLWPVRLGIMVETPAAVLLSDELAQIVDFFSIGTNDLTQYIMSAERGVRELDSLADCMQPAVLKAVRIAVESALRHNIDVSVCGEMASEPISARYLLGLGVKTLSMNGAAIGAIKKMIRECSLGK